MMSETEILKGFFAYPSVPAISEVIEESIININKTEKIKIKSWKSLPIAGKTIINEICKEINQSDVFLADLTYLNPNVLFELGYAIAKNKRICIFLDPSIEQSKNDFSRFNLSTLGYIPYSNSKDIISKYFEQSPHENISDTLLLQSQIDLESLYPTKNGFLYLKSPIDTQASIKLTQKIEKSIIKPLSVDDPQEIRMQIHTWYVKEAYESFAVVGHMLNKEQTGYQLHNAKVSFAIGLAYGFDKDVLMLAHEPYETPIDYKHLLFTHKTAFECGNHIERWLSSIEKKYNEGQQKAVSPQKIIKEISKLQSISLGDYVAEREIDTLSDYFVDTSAYRDALKARYSIFIGRKGSGKTAILYQMRNELLQDKRNHICIITPVAYELSGLVSVLTKLKEDAERGYLVQSIWKYLIYSELSRSIYLELKDKPVYYELSKEENDIIYFVDNHKELILEDFSIRLEYVVRRCLNIEQALNASDTRIKISEMLHDSIISQIRALLIKLLSTKNRVVILIDNLDKSWKRGPNLNDLVDFLLGLLSVSTRISEELNQKIYKKNEIDFSIVIFLRTDIFTYIYRAARERDKILYMPIRWEDPELLNQVIIKRLDPNQKLTDNYIWNYYFCPQTQGISTKEFFLKNVLPRPRDIIYWVKMSIINAISRKHTIIEERDIIDAQKRYSQHVFDSLIVENGINVEEFERLLYEFVGVKNILTTTEIEEIIKRSNIPLKTVDEIIDLLCERSFLGREIGKDKFRYQNNYMDNEVIRALEKKYKEDNQNKINRYEINIPFRSYLEIN